MIALICWAAEFLLESSGAFLAFRRRLDLLCALLSIRAIADIASFALMRLNLHPAYGYSWWTGETATMLFLCAIACELARRMAGDYQRIARYVCFVAAAIGSVAAVLANHGPTWMAKFLDAEIGASLALMVVLGVAWIGQKGPLEMPWRGIGAGVVVYLIGRTLCAMLWQRWHWGADLYPIPAIAALMVWNYAAWTDKRRALLIESVPPKFPVQSVLAREQSRMVQ